jgi:hypothetical protein
MRNVFLILAAFIVANLGLITTFSPTAGAAGEAKWEGESIIYNGDTYKRRDDIKPEGSLNLPAGTKIFMYLNPADAQADNPNRTAKIIYFEPDSDPQTAKKATYIVYKYDPPDSFSDPTGKAAVSFTDLTDAEKDELTTSCVVEGIGWIVCPITNFLSSAMDKLFDIMSNFLTVRPVQTDQETALYRGWAMMRNFANVAFVIAFMIIIYSQVTNMGLSSYGLQRMLPRLIAAAILVNISYWICAVFVDLSNISGYALYDLLTGMKDDLVGAEGNGFSITWSDLGSFVLSGGTAAAATGVGLYAFAATAGGAIYMLLPVLVGVLISALVALLIMAARQAIITILIIIAPLAFVAYLLPNTEKYFKKWGDLFSTMLFLFPAFSIVLGGAQFAGDAIVQNANSIELIVLGMAVKIAPVVITPFLLKFSGSLLGKIAGVVNNPGKGLVDRTRNFAQEKNDAHKAKSLANRSPGFLARRAQNIDGRKRKREGWKKANETRRDANWAGSQDYSDIHAYDAKSSQLKEIGENKANEHVAVMQATDAAAQGLDIRARASKLDLDVSKAKVDANWEAIKAGDSSSIIAPSTGVVPSQVAVNALATHTQGAARDLRLTKMREESAGREQTAHLTQELLNNTNTIDGQSLRDYAGGVQGVKGAESAFSTAVSMYRKEYNDQIQNRIQLMKHFNVNSEKRQDLALGESIDVVSNTGVHYTFKGDDDYAREAAIEEQLRGGSYSQIESIIKESGKATAPDGTVIKGKTSDYATTIAGAIVERNLSKKAVFLGSQTIDDVGQGKLYGDAGLDNVAVRAIIGGKIKDEELAAMSASAIKRLFAVQAKADQTEYYTNASTEEKASFDKNMLDLKHSAHRIMKNPLLNRAAEKAARDVLEKNAIQPPPQP